MNMHLTSRSRAARRARDTWTKRAISAGPEINGDGCKTCLLPVTGCSDHPGCHVHLVTGRHTCSWSRVQPAN